ncbi:hypothetical protein PRIPAC_85242 [Pristionchus pacificus]|uniref:Uncharacterized protein n=1 Tax=Pristionchus pacificus TaxID=54126 RepID=A0A2A6BV37_PRIPA|nr:hypothetical protein PRIPAC_85242 [Pristionchus pacificus]|eukprot:PDM69686.1 hypothetical protein PRIPAC_44782 [Pristionchus pacificus]
MPGTARHRPGPSGTADVISQTNADSILLHITKATNHAELRGIDFTARAILDAYELLCASPLATKLVKFSVSKKICDELFGMLRRLRFFHYFFVNSAI